MDSDFSLDDIEEAAKQFVNSVGNKRVIAFHGEMGSGKTTFISAICKALNVRDKVSSPTFSIINVYRTTDGKSVFHIDLYRLKDKNEIIAAGVEECIQSGKFCLVEWPGKMPELFTENTVHVHLKTTGINTRQLRIKL